MVWKHIFWNDDFIVTNKDDWAEVLAGKVFANIQFEVYCVMKDWSKWPRFYYGMAWDFRLKNMFLEIVNVVKKCAREGPSASKKSPKIHSTIISNKSKPYISIVIFDENEELILEVPGCTEDLQFFANISHMI